MTAPSRPSRAPRRRAATPRQAQGQTALSDVMPRFDPAAFVPLKTDRLTLRPFKPEDAAGLHRLINNFDVAKMLELVAFPYSRVLADEWIAAAINDFASGAACHLAITGHEGAQEVLV